ncbi:hypothetical protein CNEO4_990060 [Clostridium neonatale]|nr:hypothetical protein CNEO4_990060 [Clostridium neonatale]
MIFIDKSNELLELMTKMYSEMQEMKGEINNRFDGV